MRPDDDAAAAAADDDDDDDDDDRWWFLPWKFGQWFSLTHISHMVLEKPTTIKVMMLVQLDVCSL